MSAEPSHLRGAPVAGGGERGVAARADERFRVLIVGAHEVTRLGLAFLLQRQPWVERCYLAEDQERAVVLARRRQPHVALVDVAAVAPSQATLAGLLRRAQPSVRLVFTTRSEQPGAEALARACGAAYVPPDAPGVAYLRTVHDLASGRVAVVASDDPGHEPTEQLLTARERDVLSLLATGATNREIAAALHLGPDAVKKRATSIYRKLGVRNRTEATQRAHELVAG